MALGKLLNLSVPFEFPHLQEMGLTTIATYIIVCFVLCCCVFLSLDTSLPFPHPPLPKLLLSRRGLCDLIIFVSLLGTAIVYLLQWAFDAHPAHSRCSLGFPGGSDSKESACNAGDWSSIPGWGRSPREGGRCSLNIY